MSQLILIRTDASIQIGSGHVMRCLTLAEALRDSGATVGFIARAHPGNLNEYIQTKGFKVHSLPVAVAPDSQHALSGYEQWLGVKQEADAEDTIQVLADTRVDWLIIDHYALDHSWEEVIRTYARKIMVIDDLANRRHECDILLDQNYIHDQHRYDPLLSPESIKLLGPEFALLGKSFAKSHLSSKQKHGEINNVFVFFGGSDPDNLTTTALKALAQPDLKHLTVDVVIGSSNPHQMQVKALVSEHLNAQLHIQVENIAELMAKADIALGAGGTTTWERMSIGLPSIVVTIAENQIAFTRDLELDGYIKWLGNTDQVNEDKIHNALLEAIQNPRKLQEQSRKGKKLITGKGAQRIAKLLMEGPDPETLTVRKAKSTDCLLYWHWVNDPIVRENAFNQQVITWKNHKRWFDARLNDHNTILLLIECDFGPIGQVRFDYSDSHYMIDYSIAKQFRGFSLGKIMLAKAIDYLRKEQSFTLIGDVKETNRASRKVFEELGFKQTVPLSQKGVYRYLLKCPRITNNDKIMRNRNTYTTITEDKI